MDLRIDGLDGEKAQLQREVATLEGMLAESRQKIESRRQDAATLEDEKRGLEGGLSAENDNIVRSETNLKEIKTQKEYQAVSKEISGAKKLIAELEDQILQKINSLEEV